ncbi:hypothetical protein [Thermomonas carbonis]|uniref:Uncharacterized protein n=1 Tax=Thermomonas carbonis TaxID=1463158 RepID=A0A7G9SPH8_9GAMM|nr:hypothetical protein [Thermomonas carbonis]QNN69753.1 hypothetical protein H9L16_14025 [Thermomonas carbonis]GHB95282.1 hypothetical protein GCM10010080_03390 [Thermomonas carbonis]
MNMPEAPAALPPAERIARWVVAAPDAITAGFFLLLWLVPHWLWADALRTGLLMMLVEFILVHATGFLGSMAMTNPGNTRRRWKPILLFAGFYLLFIAAWSWSFEAWWPLLAFAWLVAGKLALAWQPLADADKAERLRSEWGISVLAYLGGVFITMLLPLPRLGLTSTVVAAADLPGSGEWVDKPHTVVAFGLLYFGVLAISKLRGWTLPGKPVSLRNH